MQLIPIAITTLIHIIVLHNKVFVFTCNILYWIWIIKIYYFNIFVPGSFFIVKELTPRLYIAVEVFGFIPASKGCSGDTKMLN